jgi:hypothetical protein
MGKRTVYYKPTNGKTLRENFETDYNQFRDWILETNNQSITEYNERFINVELEKQLRGNSVDKFEDWSQVTIDSLIFEYLLTYCDYGPGQDRFNIIGPMMLTRNYEKSNVFINGSSDEDLKAIWNYLIYGRSIKNGRNFTSHDNDNQVIGFWDAEERIFLHNQLSKIDIKTNDSEGVEYVLSVIDEMKDDKSDLIIYVEK